MTNRSSIMSPVASLIRIACLLWMCLAADFVFAEFEASAVFETQCSGCHSVGKGVVVGPDLAGVNERHDRGWLHRFIRASQRVIRSGDPSAKALFEMYAKVMPDHDFTDAEIDQLLALIAAGGPRAPVLEELRPASAASAAEVERGRALFTGAQPLSAGGSACMHCHAAGPGAWMEDASLASDLSQAYLELGDWGTVRALRQPDAPLMRHTYAEKPLTPAEIFALKAFLRSTAALPRARVGFAHPVTLAGAGVAGLVLWLAGRVARRRSR